MLVLLSVLLPGLSRVAHIVVALDRRRGSLVADALDHVGVKGALQQEVHLPDALRLLLRKPRGVMAAVLAEVRNTSAG